MHCIAQSEFFPVAALSAFPPQDLSFGKSLQILFITKLFSAKVATLDIPSSVVAVGQRNHQT